MVANKKLTKNYVLLKNLVRSNVLWFTFSSPFILSVYIMNSGRFSESYSAVVILILTLSIITVFPATSALFAVIRKLYLKKEASTVISFIQYYKENFRQSFFGGIILMLLWFLWQYLYEFNNVSPFTTVVFVLMAIGLMGVTVNFFSVIVHMKVNLIIAFRNAIVFTMGGNIYSILINIINLIIIYISVYYLPILLVFLSGSIIGLMNFSGFYKQMSVVLYHKDKMKNDTEEK